jgi:hypothetical protein
MSKRTYLSGSEKRKRLAIQKENTVELRLSGLINVKGGPDKQISG